MKRRDFLMMGSGTGVLLGAKALARPPYWQTTGESFQLPELNTDWVLGYWQGSERFKEPTAPFRAPELAETLPGSISLSEVETIAPFSPDLVDATTLRPDENLAGKQARLTLIGLQPEARVWYESEIQDFYLYAATAPRETYPDLEPISWWSYRGDVSPKHGSPTRCSIQIEAGKDLIFDTAQDPDSDVRKALILAMKPRTGLPKARSGVYVVAGRDIATGRFPDWVEYQFRASDAKNQGARKYLYRKEGDTMELANFPYLILTLQV